MSTLAQQTCTPDDLLHMPDGDRYELVDGQLVEIGRGGKSSWIGGEVFGLLRDYAKQQGGWAFPGRGELPVFSVRTADGPPA